MNGTGLPDRYGRVYYDDVLLARMAMETERLAGRTLASIP